MFRSSILLIPFWVAGCASFSMMDAPPPSKHPIHVQVSTSAKPNPNSVVVYQIPGSSTFIPVRPDMGPIMGAGLLTAAIGYNMAKEKVAESIAGKERNLTVDMVAATNSMLGAKLTQLAVGSELRVGGDTKGAARLSLLPYLALVPTPAAGYRQFVFLDAIMKDESGTELWQRRYIATTSEERPLAGDSGWSSESGWPLSEAVARAMDQALSLALRDLTGKLPRASAPDVLIKAIWPMSPLGLWAAGVHGKLIESGDKTVIFVPRFPDGGWFAGVYQLPKETTEISTTSR